MWAREGQVFITDVENGYFLVCFSCQKDLEHALTVGPWVILDHYLTIRSWEPDFNPFQAVIARITAWVRLPGFPIEYANTELIKGIGNWLGKFIKVDAATTSLARGRFARICVELDLTKPLSAEYKLEGRLKQVKYERLPLVCYSCGQYGYRSEMCSIKSPTENDESSQSKTREEQGGKIVTSMATSYTNGENAKENKYGPWMLVNRQRRFNRNSDSAQKGKKENQFFHQPTGRQSSKFTALENDSNGAEDEKEENLSVEINDEARGAKEGPSVEKSLNKKEARVTKERHINKEKTSANSSQVENKVHQKTTKTDKEEFYPKEIPSIQILSRKDIPPNKLMQSKTIQKIEIQQALRPPDQKQDDMEQDNLIQDMQTRDELDGAVGKEFSRVLKNLVKNYHICMISLLEPRANSSSGSKIMKKCGFNSCYVEEAQGFSGGIWFMWDSNEFLNLIK
ncbi:uncharacterized protein LOC133290057 [Gastrolobium bilobum]|uniref:uncharacterized protein LOC133290057 n=1 Tax=Gastrolobium bilobum TaxID=150636 RepID=UPI002AAFB53C|nr:uncharacterized protein LOC133290057 [Gastrolobium bilobum]